MSFEHDETRSVISLRTGTKICILAAVPMIAAAVYFLLVPVIMKTSQGNVFDCGSALHPPTDAFPKNVCRSLPDINRYRTYLSLAAAVVTIALGFVFFGVDRTEQHRQDVDLLDHEVTGDAADAPAPTSRRAARESAQPTRSRRRRWEDEDEDDDESSRF